MANIKTNCPICDAQISLADDAEESEIITCTECSNRIIVESIKDGQAILGEAPAVEEDWGE